LLDKRVLGWGYIGCNVLISTFRKNCEEDKHCSMRDYLVELFCWDSSQN
jgi:hypothetical protein